MSHQMTIAQVPLGRLALVLMQAAIIGCLSPNEYRGDGDLSDRGSTTATYRYVLDLGPLENGSTSFALAALPSVQFTVGFLVDGLGLDEAQAAARDKDVEVCLTLTTAAGETVFDESGHMGDWVWTSGVEGRPSAFAYRRGEHEEHPLSGGGVKLQRVGSGADWGMGHLFQTSPQ